MGRTAKTVVILAGAFVGGGGIVFMLMLFASILSGGDKTRSMDVRARSTPPTTSRPLEEALAFIDCEGGTADPLDVKRFKYLLERLDDLFREDQKTIGDQVVATQNLLREAGIRQSMIPIMEGMCTVCPPSLKGQPLADNLAIYCTMRKNGYPHQEAVNALGDLAFRLSEIAK